MRPAITTALAALCAAICVFSPSAFNRPVFAEGWNENPTLPGIIQTLDIDLDHDGISDPVQAFPATHDLTMVLWQIMGDNNSPTTIGSFLIPYDSSEGPLGLTANGSLTVSWGCFACGRSHLRTVATLQFTNGDLRVIGYDYSNAVRIYGVVLTCSVNLLTQDVIITASAAVEETQKFKSDDRAYPATDLINQLNPKGCEALSRYDNDWMEQNMGKN